MAAHFTMPAYQKRLNPDLEEKDMQPACTSRELIDGLLRKLLGFQGLVITDQTKMMGYYGMSRPDALVQSIACGCDMILGINDMEEDYEAIERGIKAQIITPERLQ